MEEDRKLDDWIDSFMLYTENSEPPRQFRTWTAISVIAAALERKCYLDWGSLSFYPNLYIVLVGPSGCRKGTAMSPGLKFITSLGLKVAAESITREALIRELKEANDNEIMTDGKVILHSSLTIYSQELVVFLGTDNKQLMSDLTDWYDCREQWTYRTKNMGTDEIINVWVNLIGATTPSIIQTALPQDAIGGGLTSRMIFVNARKKEKTVPVPFLTPDELQLRDDLEYDYERIHCLRGGFQVTKDYLDAYSEWYVATDGKPPFESDHFGGYFERRPNHLIKLSMVCNASRTNSMTMDVQDFNRAKQLLEYTEQTMPYTFSGYGQSRTAEATYKILTYIKEQRIVDGKELASRFLFETDKRGLSDILASLEHGGLVKTFLGEGKVTIHYTGKDKDQ